jgi:hypothetical protein
MLKIVAGRTGPALGTAPALATVAPATPVAAMSSMAAMAATAVAGTRTFAGPLTGLWPAFRPRSGAGLRAGLRGMTLTLPGPLLMRAGLAPVGLGSLRVGLRGRGMSGS